jgi:hypothetical protein
VSDSVAQIATFNLDRNAMSKTSDPLSYAQGYESATNVLALIREHAPTGAPLTFETARRALRSKGICATARIIRAAIRLAKIEAAA